MVRARWACIIFATLKRISFRSATLLLPQEVTPIFATETALSIIFSFAAAHDIAVGCVIFYQFLGLREWDRKKMRDFFVMAMEEEPLF